MHQALNLQRGGEISFHRSFVVLACWLGIGRIGGGCFLCWKSISWLKRMHSCSSSSSVIERKREDEKKEIYVARMLVATLHHHEGFWFFLLNATVLVQQTIYNFFIHKLIEGKNCSICPVGFFVNNNIAIMLMIIENFLVVLFLFVSWLGFQDSISLHNFEKNDKRESSLLASSPLRVRERDQKTF